MISRVRQQGFPRAQTDFKGFQPGHEGFDPGHTAPSSTAYIKLALKRVKRTSYTQYTCSANPQDQTRF
jgi:hypothetical protein